MNTIRAILCEYSISILIFGLTFFTAFIITLLIHSKRKTRYLLWKKETIHLGIYRVEKEFGKDKFIEELFTENLRLETENKLLKKQVSNTKFAAIAIFIIMLLAMWFRRHKNDKNEAINENENIYNGNLSSGDDQTTLLIEEETQ